MQSIKTHLPQFIRLPDSSIGRLGADTGKAHATVFRLRRLHDLRGLMGTCTMITAEMAKPDIGIDEHYAALPPP